MISSPSPDALLGASTMDGGAVVLPSDLCKLNVPIFEKEIQARWCRECELGLASILLACGWIDDIIRMWSYPTPHRRSSMGGVKLSTLPRIRSISSARAPCCPATVVVVEKDCTMNWPK